MRIIFITIVFIFFNFSLFGQVEEKLLHAIRTDNLEEFRNNFEEPYLNQSFGSDSLEALAYAAFFRSNDVLKWLLEKGAEINNYSGGLTPLMWAARSGNPDAIKLLIDYRAGVNLKDGEGNTALIYASAGDCMECVKSLVYSGAEIQVRNRYGYDAEFYARRAQSKEIRNFLRYHKIIYDLEGKAMRDGPHFRWIEEDRVRMFYFVARANKKKVRLISKTKKPNGLPFNTRGFAGDTNSYTLLKNYEPKEAIYEGKNKIFVVGDVHGNYEQTVSILKNAGIIKNDLSWNWGEGHLILIGDIFDRGDRVTELLWFIHSLQIQAGKNNGHVHLILGNHEVMNLMDDTRYISDKYFYLSSKTGMEYSETFDDSYELGMWLRSLNTMIKINDILFVHAGISNEMVEKNLSISEVNNGMRQFLSSNIDTTHNALGDFLSGEKGPLWYRGYLQEGESLNQENKIIFEKSLDFYNVNRIIVGHTPAQNFRMDFDNQLIYIDVSSAKGDRDEKALLIDNKNYYKVFFDGSLKQLFK